MKTSEEKQAAIKWLLSQLKVFGLTFTAAMTTVWGVAEFYLEDYVKETATQIIEERTDKKSFRDILSEELKVSSDAVPYYLSGKLVEVDTLNNRLFMFQTKYKPILDTQIKYTVIYRYLDENGEEWWHGYDNRSYRVNYDEGKAWVLYHGFRKNL